MRGNLSPEPRPLLPNQASRIFDDLINQVAFRDPSIEQRQNFPIADGASSAGILLKTGGS